MKWLRIMAMLLGASLILGEAYRSWGMGRPAAFWLDDMVMGGFLITGAVLAGQPGWQRRALFSASWGVCAGMLYGSFFGKLFEPATATPGNFSLGTLTLLLGIAFAVSLWGLVFSLTLPPVDTSTDKAPINRAETAPTNSGD